MKNYLIKNKFIRKDGKLNSNKIRYICDSDYKSIYNYTSFLDENSSISERIYCIINNINFEFKCNNCRLEKPIFDGFSKGYRKYCSYKCLNNSKEVKDKKRKTSLERYGTESILQNKNINEKARNSIYIKYGVNNISQAEEIKNKKIDTCNKNLGVDYPTQSEEVIRKIKNNNNIYYGVDSYNQKHIENYELYNNVNYILQNFYFNDGSVNLYSITKFFSITVSTARNHFKKLNLNWKVNKSKYETDIINFLEKNNIKNIISPSKKIIPPYEIDIYLSDYNIAIEFNGLYWHRNKEKNYHLNKTDLCKDKNIQLLHIFENEWIESSEIWKSIILSKLKLNKRIGARKCKIKEINNKTKNEFLKNNHLQSTDKSIIKIGLYNNNKLLSVMTFGKPRYNKRYEWELIRFCNKIGYNIVGGASKLFKYFFIKYCPNNIISYASISYSNGNLYEKLGFSYINRSSPNYIYFKNNQMLSREQCQKHKLKDFLENSFDQNKTEKQNMIDNGWGIVYNCGNYVYEWKAKNVDK